MEDLGQLPSYEPEKALEADSLKKLQAFLPSDQLCVRDERTVDQGVDLSLEVVERGQSTNFRSQVQLKARTRVEPRKGDNKRALSVKVSNLNYLMNGPCPLFVLFDASEEAFFICWARDAVAEFDRSEVAWRTQDSVTLTFEGPLTLADVATIRAKIAAEARFLRESLSVVATASGTDKVTVTVSPDGLKVLDTGALASVLASSGSVHVGRGFAREILELIATLPPETRRRANIQFVRAQASFARGNFRDTVAAISEVRMSSEKLDVDELAFIDYLEAAAKFHLGLIDHAKLVEAEGEISGRCSDTMRLMLEFDATRNAWLASTDPPEKRRLSLELSNRYQDIRVNESVDPGVKSNAALQELFARGARIADELRGAIFNAKIRTSTGIAPVDTVQLEAIVAAAQACADEILSIANSANAEGNRSTTADALSTLATIGLVFCIATGDPIHIASALVPYVDLARQAHSIYLELSNYEGQVRIGLLIAEMLTLTGAEAEAREITSNEARTASALGLRIGPEASAVTGGAPNLARQLLDGLDFSDENTDLRISGDSDEVIESYARKLWQAFGLPESAFQNVLQDVKSLRLAATTRIEWCRHFELLTSNFDTTKSSQPYSMRATFAGSCTLKQIRGSVAGLDDEQAVQVFRRAYCTGCAERDPLP